MDNFNEKIENQEGVAQVNDAEVSAAPAEETPVTAPADETTSVPAEESGASPEVNATFCSKCGYNLGDMNFCPKCGTPKAAAPAAPSAAFNPAYPAYQAPVNQYYPQPMPAKKKPPVWLFVILGVVVLIIGIVIIAGIAGSSGGSNNAIIDDGPDFQEVYRDIGSPYYCEVGSDGSYLTIDTNYFDTEDYIDMEAYYDLEEIVELLDLPESLIEEFGQTRALDGRLTRTYDDITVSWSYHPDDGLEVMFEEN